MNEIRVLRVTPNGEAAYHDVQPDYRELGKLVGGFIEGIGGDGWTAYLNEDGKLDGLPVNALASRIAGRLGWSGAMSDILVGPVIFLGPLTSSGHETSVAPLVAEAVFDLSGRVVAEPAVAAVAEPEPAVAEVLEAAELGKIAGESAASWVFDGNTTTETYQACLRMDDDGDPAWDDQFGLRSGPLSGEDSDSMTTDKLLRELGLDPNRMPGWDPKDDELADAVAAAYESAVYQAYRDAVVKAATEALA